MSGPAAIRHAVAAGPLAIMSIGAASASADVTVTNLMQPGLMTTPAPAPVTAAPSGTCAEPLTVAEANGETPYACPAAWPAMASWWTLRQNLPVAGGDTLTLRFSTPPDQVRYTLLSNWPTGLSTPDGVRIPNVAFAGPADLPSPATPTDAWTLTIPALTFNGGGPDLSITTRTGADWTSYAIGLVSPRSVNPDDQCPVSYLNAGQALPVTCKGGVKGPPFRPTGTATPTQTPVTTPTPACHTTVAVTSRPRLRGHSLSLALQAGSPGTLTLRLSRAGHVVARLHRHLTTTRATAIHTTLPARALRGAHALAYTITYTATCAHHATTARGRVAVR
jgi:hypothetical protein